MDSRLVAYAHSSLSKLEAHEDARCMDAIDDELLNIQLILRINAK